MNKFEYELRLDALIKSSLLSGYDLEKDDNPKINYKELLGQRFVVVNSVDMISELGEDGKFHFKVK